MPAQSRKLDFFTSEDGIAAKAALEKMALDEAFNTKASYSANTVLHPDNVISFVERHMNYLRDHANVDCRQYLANLRLMTRNNPSRSAAVR